MNLVQHLPPLLLFPDINVKLYVRERMTLKNIPERIQRKIDRLGLHWHLEILETEEIYSLMLKNNIILQVFPKERRAKTHSTYNETTSKLCHNTRTEITKLLIELAYVLPKIV